MGCLGRSATTEYGSMYARNQIQKIKRMSNTRCNVENPQSGKNHDSPRAVKYTIEREEYNDTENTEATTSCFLLLRPHTAAVTRRRQRPLSHTLSLSRSLSLLLCTRSYNNNTTTLQNECPKSYLYLYDFSAYLHFCLPIGRYRSGPVLR